MPGLQPDLSNGCNILSCIQFPSLRCQLLVRIEYRASLSPLTGACTLAWRYSLSKDSAFCGGRTLSGATWELFSSTWTGAFWPLLAFPRTRSAALYMGHAGFHRGVWGRAAWPSHPGTPCFLCVIFARYLTLRCLSSSSPQSRTPTASRAVVEFTLG